MPFFRFDPHFSWCHSNRAGSAGTARVAWEVVEPVRLSRGDLLIIDNRRTAHARSPSRPLRWHDRWMQRAFAIATASIPSDWAKQPHIRLVTELERHLPSLAAAVVP
ncbi:hypothetical protein [Stutzerimonas xanthomarina]|uniref:hypothetical protein n=1 Tax=Stutzerimonas xanthomarina TaxID=271420 RepID=UPI003AA8AA52